MTHELSITVERDGKHFVESSVDPGKVLEGPFATAEEALERSVKRSEESPNSLPAQPDDEGFTEVMPGLSFKIGPPESGEGPKDANEAVGKLAKLRSAVPPMPGVDVSRVPGPEGDAYRAALDEVLDGFGSQENFAKQLGVTKPGKFVEPLVAQDFLDTAVVISGPSPEAPVAQKLGSLHRRMGKHPHEVISDIAVSPDIRDDLLSNRTLWPRAYGDPPEPKIEPPVEEPSLFSRAMEDIGEFITDTSAVVTAPTAGVLKGLDDLMETTGLNDAMRELDRAIRPILGNAVTETVLMQVSIPAEQETATGQIVQEGARFFTKAGPAVAITAPLGAAAIVNWAFGGLVAGFLRPPEEDTIADVLKQMGPFENSHLEVLREIYATSFASDEDDSAFEKRLKAAAEEGILSFAGDGAIIALVKIYGLGKRLFSAQGRQAIVTAGQRAEQRIEERRRTRGTTLSAGVDPRELTDPLVAMAGKAAAKGGKAPVFFSNTGEAVSNAKFDKGTAQQWLALPGLKKEEIEFSGLDKFLESKTGSVSKKEVLDFLEQNGVRLEETVKAERAILESQEIREAQQLREQHPIIGDRTLAIRDRLDELDNIIGDQNEVRFFEGPNDDPKFAQWQLPGGENYREVLIRLPDNKAPRTFEEYWAQTHVGDVGDASPGAVAVARGDFERFGQNIANPNAFRGGHFDEPNVLAHVRMNDRIDAEGRKVLFIEEIQSDWHQKGRKQGYETPESRVVRESSGAGMVGVPDAPFKKTWPELGLKRAIREAVENGQDAVAWTTGAQQVDRYEGALRQVVDRIEWTKTPEGIHIRGLKGVNAESQLLWRQLNGRWAWFSGDSQVSGAFPDFADREAARSTISSAQTEVVNTTKAENEISDAIGKSMGDSIIASPAQSGFFEGDGIKIDSTGMAAFYDRMLVSSANRIGKKFGAKVGDAEIPTKGEGGVFRIGMDRDEMFGVIDINGIFQRDMRGFRTRDEAEAALDTIQSPSATVHTLEITPALKDEVLKNGLPLFSVAGLAADQLDVRVPDILFPEEDAQEIQGASSDEIQVAGLLKQFLKVLPRAVKPTREIENVLGRISTGGRPSRGLRWDRLYRDTVDDLHQLKRAVDDLIEGDIPIGQDPYKLARLNRGVNGKAEHFLEFSPFKFGTYENVGRSLKAILEPFNGRLDDVRAYAVAKRSQELRKRGIETGVPEADAVGTIAKLGPEIEPVFRELVEFQDHVLAYLKDSGVLSDDAVKAMRELNKDYVPFFRLMDDQEAKGGLGKGLQASQPVKKIKGSTRQIIDPLESIIKNTYLFINIADRNAVGAALFDLAQSRPGGDAIAKMVAPPMRPTRVSAEETLLANPEIAQILEQYNKQGVSVSAEDFSIFRPNTFVVARDQIAFYRDGKRHLLQVDPDIADTFKALDQESANTLVKILGFPARLLRAGAVLSPEFIARNPFRDQISAFIFSEKGFQPFLDLARGIYSMSRKDALFQDWLKSGGPMASLVSLDRNYLQKSIRQIAGQTTLWEKVVNVVKSPIEALRILSDLAERGTRLGEFSRVAGGGQRSKEAIQTGGFASREVTLDFQRIGAKTRSVNALIAFWNASIQGTDKTIRAFKTNPGRTTAKIAAGITVPSVILQAINRNEPGWKDIPQWQKDLFWLVRTGPDAPPNATPEQIEAVLTQSTWWRIPKPFELGIVFGSGAERVVDGILDADPTAFDGLLEAFGRGATPGFMPTVMSAPIETWANRSLFTDRPIIPADREKLLPEYQYSGYTTESAKAIGKLIAQIPGVGDTRVASPAVIENWVRSWTGGLGTTILRAADFALRKSGVLPDPTLPASTLADIPFVKGFVVRHPSAGAEGIQRFFDAYDRQTSVLATIDSLSNEGEVEEAIALMDRAITDGDFLRLTGFKKALSEQSKLVRLIYKNPDIKPDEKRQLIDSIYFQMMETANLGNEIIEAAEVESRKPRPPSPHRVPAEQKPNQPGIMLP